MQFTPNASAHANVQTMIHVQTRVKNPFVEIKCAKLGRCASGYPIIFDTHCRIRSVIVSILCVRIRFLLLFFFFFFFAFGSRIFFFNLNRCMMKKKIHLSFHILRPDLTHCHLDEIHLSFS